MQDRTPTPGQEGRVLITPEDGSPAYYAKISMADNPTQEGTPYDKLNVLQDVTCYAIGIPHTSTPNEAFLALALGVGRYGYIITVLLPDGSPVEGASITGASAPNGGAAVTDENGIAILVSTEQSVTIGIDSPYIDIQGTSGVTIQSTAILTNDEITLAKTTSYVTIQASGSYQVSPLVLEYDLTAVGAGAGGGNGSHNADGAGGGGGEIVSLLGVDASQYPAFIVQIGAGGEPVSAEGTTSPIQAGSTVVTANTNSEMLKANGGYSPYFDNGEDYYTGGSGNGDGGDVLSPAGKPASGYLFDDATLGVPGGGGGGLGGGYPSINTGGSPFGGSGASYSLTQTAQDGNGPGGGGGGGETGSNPYNVAGKGADGCLFFRPHFKGE